MVVRAFDECMLESGGVNLARTMVPSDVAVDGMILNHAAYFCPNEKRVENLAGYLLAQVKPGGDFSWDGAAQTGDPHTTICVLEGFHENKQAGFTRHQEAIRKAEIKAESNC